MHGYLPCPDVYIKCLCASTKFFLERATKKERDYLSAKARGSLISLCEAAPPYCSPLARDTSSISAYDPSLAFEWVATVNHWGVFPPRAAQTASCIVPTRPGRDPRRRPQPQPQHRGSANRADRRPGSEGRAFQTSSRSSTAGVETHELRKLRPFLSPEKHADRALPGTNRVPGREHTPHPSPAAAYLAPAGAHADHSAIHAVFSLRQQRVSARPVGLPDKFRSPQARGGCRRLRHVHRPSAPSNPAPTT